MMAIMTGILSSWLFWIYTTRVIRSKIKWSPYIGRYDNPKLGQPVKYRIEIRNVGRRAATDFSATVLLKAPGYGSYRNTQIVALRTMDIPLPHLAPKKSRVIAIKTNKIPEGQISGLPQDIRELLNCDPPTSLEELLKAIPGSEMRLYLAAYDEKSGTRRTFVSQAYTADDILDKPFRGTDDDGPM
jgi:hypothetical protein